jgi:hypothetical protein
MATWGAENVTGPDNWPNCESAAPWKSTRAVTVRSLFCDWSARIGARSRSRTSTSPVTDCCDPSTSATSLAHPSPADERTWSVTLRRLSGPSSASVNAGVSGRPARAGNTAASSGIDNFSDATFSWYTGVDR